ncbi:HepT-like ribonuclease domain-containing protein [Thermococcus stetteri]|uniref:HepT-like ribonuclease domain-containing protein n=1 Tax=Thermococcus stetteri TaxID=49900 RepID=UPI001AE216C7|nr:HepT-like ribonuclease domain-containing protein [Thermococcus stetteri]MBP1912014.1 uncharacterized protein with HEPN domain [Thermococcus stetteri]
MKTLQEIVSILREHKRELEEKYPEVPPRAMASMRNRVIHGYFGINPEIVWTTLVKDLPPLQEKLQEILNELEGEK